ncbi:Manganese transport system membrane protein MntB [Rubripirellula obstinata]|uniref:Manganese transport system membrane protein MntB n=3 Tax=Rubripirellula obstinata TaxID=406547 RepID=A0A5B1CLU9_9BACT|nr:Manganese transport system membrane protein MntB [Rubripirellula obstinata]
MRDYNTRVVVLGVAMLGGSSGLVGSFTLLRRRALMGDALSHASLPGIALAFMLATTLGYDGKYLPLLLAGATFSGLLGVGCILWIRNKTRLKEDTALGIVLSVFFGAGVALLGMVQQMKTGNAAGLEGFIYGKTASMSAMDVRLIFYASLIAIALSFANFKELKLLCFDEGFAGSRGYPVVLLDVLLMSLVVLVAMVGLQAVGLILMIALLVIPAAAARFWTDTLWKMTAYSVILGTVGCVIGAMVSAVFPNLPSGAMIVLVCSFFFFLSMFFGTARGVVARFLRRRRLNRRIDRQHLMRAMYEQIEHPDRSDTSALKPGSEPVRKTKVSIDELLLVRSWNWKRLMAAIRSAEVDELMQYRHGHAQLTHAGFIEAARLTRQHRLWEMYLITYADVAPALVDRDADNIEHVLEPHVIDRLEDLLEEQELLFPVPTSPHELGDGLTSSEEGILP